MSTSGPLDDSSILFLKLQLTRTAVQWVVHGLYTALVVMALHMLWAHRAHLAPRNILITAIITMFSLSTTGLALGIAGDVADLDSWGFNAPANSVHILVFDGSVIANLFLRLNFWISDSIVVWRAWVLWTHHIWARGLLIFCLLLSIGDPPMGPTTLILTLPLFLTNFIATFLIGYKVWEYRMEIKRTLGISKHKRSKVEKILILLTESGTIYCGLLLFTLVNGITSHSARYEIVISIVPELTVIYPIIIILLVALDKTNLETTVNAPSFSQPIQFVSGHQPTGTDIDVRATNTHIASTKFGGPNTENGLETPL
ncbi:hypothetical protein C8J56DRAFT_1075612 [Mycena floridula]|nr:hypothetical protein C8J56DRAFT_1075612 [Mycena floridula]